MSRYEHRSEKVTPAQLSFLTIFNPSIGSGKDALNGQIVFWQSSNDKEHIHGKNQDRYDDGNATREEQEENEKLRQIGLAQGMVNFAKNFSNGEKIDSIETDKHRIVLTELETDWWILASIGLTKLPLSQTSRDDSHGTQSNIEYSSREVSPPSLLLQQLRRANSIFLLHHADSLNDLWASYSRVKFCEIIGVFWRNFVQNWDVFLHGNPAIDIFNGTKLASGGELGIGVGEEEWGSSEREVLEGLISTTEGLEDMVLSRFGDPELKGVGNQALPSETESAIETSSSTRSWMGNGCVPSPADGVVFSGIGRISHQSIRDISGWVEWIYIYGDEAYAVKRNIRSGRDRGKWRFLVERPLQGAETQIFGRELDAKTDIENISAKENRPANEYKVALEPSKSRPITARSSDSGDEAPNSKQESKNDAVQKSDNSKYSLADSLPKPQLMMKYLTLGYGTAWTGIGKRTASIESKPQSTPGQDDQEQLPRSLEYEETASLQSSSAGYFIVGLQGDLNSLPPCSGGTTSRDASMPDNQDCDLSPDDRTVYVKFALEQSDEGYSNSMEQLRESNSTSSTPLNSENHSTESKRLKIIVYVHRPFIFTLLFHENTSSLTTTSFYYNLHRHLSTLHKQLLLSTNPNNVTARILSVLDPQEGLSGITRARLSNSSIFDLIYDPKSSTVRSSIPNIPMHGFHAAEGIGTSWSRVESLSIHSHIINTYADTRRSRDDFERTGKTRHAWWIVWMRLFGANAKAHDIGPQKEAFLIRRASEYPALNQSSTLGRFAVREMSSGSAGSTSSNWGPARLAEGVGIDARRYVESLLSLAR